jgi:predicted cupin superfamily sugar epimerase
MEHADMAVVDARREDRPGEQAADEQGARRPTGLDRDFNDGSRLQKARETSQTMPTAREIITALELQPHPIEGGYFRETYRARGSIPAHTLPPGYPGQAERSLGTSIYYLLTSETFSEMHRLPTEEVFHLYLGGPVRMLQLFPDGTGREIVLGSDILAGQEPQVVVPAGVWQGSLLEPGVELALLGATMAPGFDYADYEQGRREDLLARYPAHGALITRLTRH